MKKLANLIIIPLLVFLSIGSSDFISLLYNQNCKMMPTEYSSSCGCESMSEDVVIDLSQNHSCCCDTKNNNANEVVYLLTNPKLIVFDQITKVKYFRHFDLAKKANIIENYSAYFSSGLDFNEKTNLNPPPIYQKYCSLRI